MGHKKSVRTIKSAHWKLISLISREKYAEAREQLKKIVGAAMQLTSDLHALELRSNVDKYLKQSGLIDTTAGTKPPTRGQKTQASSVSVQRVATKPVRPGVTKRRPRLPLTARDKEVIADMTQQGRTLREISVATKRSPSTVWDYQQTLKQTKIADRAERAWLTPEERATFWMQKLGIAPSGSSDAPPVQRSSKNTLNAASA